MALQAPRAMSERAIVEASMSTNINVLASSEATVEHESLVLADAESIEIAAAPEGDAERETRIIEIPAPDGAWVSSEQLAVAEYPTPHSTHHPDTARPTPPLEVFPPLPS